MTNEIDVVFFDVHGTLIYQVDAPPAIFKALCAEANIDLPLVRVEEAYPPMEELHERAEAYTGDEDVFWRGINADILAELGIADEDGSLAEHLMTGFKRAEWWSAYDDVIPTLETLKEAGFRVSTIANARHLIMGRLHHTGLLERFDAITYSEEVGYKKPDARLFEVALGRMNVTADRTVHVGDRIREDVQGATSFGLRAILLDREDQHSDANCERIQALSELPLILTDGSP